MAPTAIAKPEGTEMSAHPNFEPGNAELDRHGIERIPADVFLWRGQPSLGRT
jgi:hypothetical protein